MAKYLVVHPVGKELTVEAATPFAKEVKANITQLMLIGLEAGMLVKKVNYTVNGMQKMLNL